MSTSMPDKPKANDYTKTRTYAYLDLTTKVVSAFALVALGLAGWVLQSQTEKTRQANEKFEREERRYLPMLRSLSNLELILDDTSQELGFSEPSIAKGNRLMELSIQLRYAAESIFEPDGDVQIQVSKVLHIGAYDLDKRETIKLPLKASVLMCSELLQLSQISMNQDENSTWAIGKEGFLEQVNPAPRRQFVTQVYTTWSALIQNGSITFPFFMKSSDLVWPLIELRLQVVRLIQEILRTHVDLGDRYIQIRAELEKNHVPYAKRQAADIKSAK